MATELTYQKLVESEDRVTVENDKMRVSISPACWGSYVRYVNENKVVARGRVLSDAARMLEGKRELAYRAAHPIDEKWVASEIVAGVRWDLVMRGFEENDIEPRYLYRYIHGNMLPEGVRQLVDEAEASAESALDPLSLERAITFWKELHSLEDPRSEHRKDRIMEARTSSCVAPDDLDELFRKHARNVKIQIESDLEYIRRKANSDGWTIEEKTATDTECTK